MAVNDIIKRGLSDAPVPSKLEPTGFLRLDGKRPNGSTLAPWKSGQSLVWDATCTGTFALSDSAQATQEPGRVATVAEERKSKNY